MVTASVAVTTKGVAAPVMPSDIAQCHKVIAEQAAMIAEVKDQLVLLRQQLSADESDAKCWRDFKSKSGRRGRQL